MTTPAARHEPRDVLTITIEDYFQVRRFNRYIPRGHWYRFEDRIEHSTGLVLDLLDRYRIRATFFVLGSIAARFPEIVRAVAARGHEIASKGFHHRSLRQMAPAEFREDLERAREVLERASGRRVRGFRVSRDWLRPSDLWVLDTLAEEGYAYDSSLRPIFRDFRGQPWRWVVHEHEHGGRHLWEFPLSTTGLLGLRVPIAGGNYIRQFPHRLVRGAVERWHEVNVAPFVMYFHAWELDPEQPKINVPSPMMNLRHYRNLDKMAGYLQDYFRSYRFTSIADYLGLDLSLTPAPDLGVPAARPPAAGRRGLAGSITGPRPGREGLRTRTPRPAIRTPTAGRLPVSIVVPCYNEEGALVYLANTLRNVLATLELTYEVRLIFVDDGSTDGTWPALGATFGGWSNVELVRHAHNRGVAAAILTGILRAQTEVVCSVDCDCTYDPHELAHMIPLLAEGVDLVTASPYHPLGKVRNVPAWRLFLSRSASRLYRHVLRQKLATYTSCFRVHRRSKVRLLDVRYAGYLGVVEMLGLLDLRGGKIVEYPTTLDVRMFGRSKMKTLRAVLGHLRVMARFAALRLANRAAAASSAAGEDPPHEVAECVRSPLRLNSMSELT